MMPNGMGHTAADTSAGNAVRRHEQEQHDDIEEMVQAQRLLQLIGKDHVRDLVDLLERDGEIVVEMRTTLRIQVPRPAIRGDDDASK